jgi:predicted DNA-binding protein (MmcQ/YjbR family)
MEIDWVREYCLALPDTTEKMQWGDDLVFKIGEKMYAVVALEPGDHWLAFKCSPEEFSALVERPGIIPAPYLARAQWVALETHDALSSGEIKRLLSQAYSLIFAKLSKRSQARLSSVDRSQTKRRRRKTARNSQRRRRGSRGAAPASGNRNGNCGRPRERDGKLSGVES